MNWKKYEWTWPWPNLGSIPAVRVRKIAVNLKWDNWAPRGDLNPRSQNSIEHVLYVLTYSIFEAEQISGGRSARANLLWPTLRNTYIRYIRDVFPLIPAQRTEHYD